MNDVLIADFPDRVGRPNGGAQAIRFIFATASTQFISLHVSELRGDSLRVPRAMMRACERNSLVHSR
jgi:hypothetical protein